MVEQVREEAAFGALSPSDAGDLVRQPGPREPLLEVIEHRIGHRNGEGLHASRC